MQVPMIPNYLSDVNLPAQPRLPALLKWWPKWAANLVIAFQTVSLRNTSMLSPQAHSGAMFLTKSYLPTLWDIFSHSRLFETYLGHVIHATSTWNHCAPWRMEPPLNFGWNRWSRVFMFLVICQALWPALCLCWLICEQHFQVEDVYHKADNFSLPYYIKSIVSPRRRRHFDNLIEIVSQVRKWRKDMEIDRSADWADDIQCLGRGFCHSQHLRWTRDCNGWDL